MGLEIETSGFTEFHRLAEDVSRAGAGGIRKRVYSALYRSTRPAIDAAKDSAGNLPSGGGRGARRTRLVKTGTVTVDGREYVRRRRKAVSGYKTESVADRVRDARYTVRRAPGGGVNVGIRVTATSRRGKSIDLRSLDRGRLRHPLFGNRRHWYEQTVESRWFTRPMQDNADTVERELRQAVREIDQDLTGR